MVNVKYSIDAVINELRSRMDHVEDELLTSQKDTNMTNIELNRLKLSS